MKHLMPSRPLIVLAAAVTAGCSTLAGAGLEALAGGEGGGPPPPDSYAGSVQTLGPAAEPGIETTTSVYQVAPTHDWRMGTLGNPYTPAQSIFGSFAPRRVVCQAIPVGLARVHSVPTGPAATPLLDLGFLDIGVAGPDGALEVPDARDPQALAPRAFRSGARLAGNGPVCGNRLFVYARVGPPAPGIAVHR